MRNRLVELAVAGKSAQHIVDALVEELPPLPMLYQIVRKELPRGTSVRIDEYDGSNSVGDGTPVFVRPATSADKTKVVERVNYLRLMFPELEFVVEKIVESRVVENFMVDRLEQLAKRLSGEFKVVDVSATPSKSKAVAKFKDRDTAKKFETSARDLANEVSVQQLGSPPRWTVTVMW